MRPISGLCSSLLVSFTLASASYPSVPRKYEIRNLGLNETSTSTSSIATFTPSSFSTSPTSSTSSTSSVSSASTSSTAVDEYTSPPPPPPSCLGSVTYYATTPPTVYETVTVGFTVTVTASNVPLTTPAIYTPPPPCFQSLLTPAVSSACGGVCPLNNPNIPSNTLTGSAYTSTVLVTKKTPVPTVVPDTSAPPNFNTPSTTTPQPAASPTPPVTKGATTIAPLISAAPVPAQSSGSGGGQASGGPDDNSSPAGSTKNQGNSGQKSTAAVGGNNAAPAGPVGGQTTTANIGSLVNSGIDGPTPTANKGTSGAGPAPKPTAVNVNGVPVVILPSSSGVVIGGQVISVPQSGSSTKIVANGNTFTLGQSTIIGPGTTIAFAADNAAVSPTPVTADGLTFKVGATQAIISGKTYAIGAGAPTTTLTIGGQTVVVGPSGVAVPGQTLAPAKVSAGPSGSVVSAGGVTITYDNTEAVVGSTTYRIGQGASQTFITVNGKTISLGPSGVGLASSTIPPAKLTAAPSLSAVTVNGISLSVDASEVVIGSSTYRIGSGAPTETTVINGKTMTIGPSGVGLGSTTIHPATATGSLQTLNAAPAVKPRLASSFVLIGLAAIFGCLVL